MSAATEEVPVQKIYVSDRLTVVPKVREICPAGVPAALIPTYAALADYANNTTGECWPLMETLAKLLEKPEKTVQPHIAKLEELGLVEIIERLRRPDGTFLGYKYRLPHIAAAAAQIHKRREANQRRYEEKKRERQERRERRRRHRLSKKPAQTKSSPTPADALDRELEEVECELNALGQARYAWYTGAEVPPEELARVRELEQRRHELRTDRFKRDYDWFFDPPDKSRDAEAHLEPADRRASQERDPSPPVPGTGEDTQGPDVSTPSTPSTGHECPVDPIYGTSTRNHAPPTPRRGAQTTSREKRRCPPPTGPRETSPPGTTASLPPRAPGLASPPPCSTSTRTSTPGS